MAISFKNVSVTSSCSGTQVSTSDLGTGTFPLQGTSYTNTGLSISKLFSDKRSFTTSETLDVTSGLTDFFGTSLNFGTVKHIWFYNTSASTITVGGGSNSLLNAIAVTAGGSINLTTSISTSGSIKNILVAGTGTLTYSIVLMGS